MKIFILLLIAICSATSGAAECNISPFARPARKVPTEAGPRPDTPRPATPDLDTPPPKISPYMNLAPWVVKKKK